MLNKLATCQRGGGVGVIVISETYVLNMDFRATYNILTEYA